jgi:hypothetical protein
MVDLYQVVQVIRISFVPVSPFLLPDPDTIRFYKAGPAYSREAGGANRHSIIN